MVREHQKTGALGEVVLRHEEIDRRPEEKREERRWRTSASEMRGSEL